MTSKAKEIVDKVIERLKTDSVLNPSLPETITFYKNPFREQESDDLPACAVTLRQGNSIRYNNQMEYSNTDELMVVYMAQGNDDTLEDNLYEAKEAIKDFLIKDQNNAEIDDSLHHIINDLVFTGWDMDLKRAAVGTGAIVLRFDINYYTTHEITFGDLEQANVTIKHTDAGDDTDPYVTEEIINFPTE